MFPMGLRTPDTANRHRCPTSPGHAVEQIMKRPQFDENARFGGGLGSISAQIGGPTEKAQTTGESAALRSGAEPAMCRARSQLNEPPGGFRELPSTSQPGSRVDPRSLFVSDDPNIRRVSILGPLLNGAPGQDPPIVADLGGYDASKRDAVQISTLQE